MGERNIVGDDKPRPIKRASEQLKDLPYLEVISEEHHVFEMYVPTWTWEGPSPVARETAQMLEREFGGYTILPNLTGSFEGKSESVCIARFFVPAKESSCLVRDQVADFLRSRARSIADAWGEEEVWVVYVGVQRVIKAQNYEIDKRKPANRVYWRLDDRRNGFIDNANKCKWGHKVINGVRSLIFVFLSSGSSMEKKGKRFFQSFSFSIIPTFLRM